MYVRNDWLCDRIDVVLSEAEILGVLMTEANGEYLVCGVYRPPKKNIPVF